MLSASEKAKPVDLRNYEFKGMSMNSNSTVDENEDEIRFLLERLKERALDPSFASDMSEFFYETDDGQRVVVSPVAFAQHQPCAREDIETVEQAVGFRLPDLLRRLYSEVGNGGFGPGYGFFCLGKPEPQGSQRDFEEETIVNKYKLYREHDPDYYEDDPDEEPEIWPVGLLMFLDWGCATYSAIDCSKPQLPIIRLDNGTDVRECHPDVADNPYIETCGFDSAWVEADSFVEWLEAWVDGVNLFERGCNLAWLSEVYERYKAQSGEAVVTDFMSQ